MKSKKLVTKIILFALIAATLFGSLVSSAYESYDTYTYSIDGEPLKSPAAYTPSSFAYDSSSMGLLAGNHWRYDADGDVALWLGDMNATKHTDSDGNEIKFTSEGLSFFFDPQTETFSVADHLYVLNAMLKELTVLKSEILPPFQEGASYLEVILGEEDVDLENPVFTKENVVENPEAIVAYIASVADAKISASKAEEKTKFESDPANEGQSFLCPPVAFGFDLKIVDLIVEKTDTKSLNKYLAIPATHKHTDSFDYPVTTVLTDGFKGNTGVKEMVIGENVKNIEYKSLSATGANTVYYESTLANWQKVSVDESNSNIKDAIRYYYSTTRKYGNSELRANDIVSDSEGNLYLADSGNNRIVILNKYDYSVIGVIRSYIDDNNNPQTFNNPTGIYVTDENKMVDGSSKIYVCDNGNKRVVVFDKETLAYESTINEPKNALLDEDDFTPYAIAVDIYGRIFIVSHSCHQGVIVMSGDGEFTGFIGSQKVTYDVIEQIWRRFQSEEQREANVKNLSVPFNNITVDDDGFVYVTINFTELEEQSKQLENIKTKNSSYSPVKKLNSMGVEIMKRNGFFDPGGEVDVLMPEEVSQIKDVAIGNEGSWTILDVSRSRTFTYDQNGNLLFAFGDKGDQIGNGESYQALTYQAVVNTVEKDGEIVEEKQYNLIILDSTETGNKLTVYHPTDYCDKIMSALHNENVHNYSETINNWQDVLTSNNNFDLAYIGIGKALYNQGKYKEAEKMLASAYETEYYAKAFTEIRKEIIGNWMIPIVAAIILVLVLFFKFLGWAKKKNKATSLKVGRKTYGEEMLYVFHLIFHPFDGFWDLKHEKRGSVRAATTILGITIVAFFYQAIGQGYMFNPRGDYSTVFLQVIAVLVPVLLWVVSNWCLTTLFDGEGSFKDIYIATCYSLAPLPVFVTISTILSNIFTVSEGSMVTLIVTLGYVWVAILLFFGMVVTHDYSTGKNVITTLGTIVAMAVIMFIAILFSSLVIKMVTFIVAIFSEIGNRL